MPIRPATEADLPSVVALVRAAYQHYIPILGGRRPRPMDDDYAARLSDGQLFVLEDGTGLEAVMVMEVQPEAVHIFNFAVDPVAQGRGVLRQLLGFAEAAARAHGLDLLTLYTNMAMTKNRAIYAHLGFRETREEVAPGGYHIVFMERRLE